MKPERDKKCGVCAIPQFERNNYFYGKLMTAREFLQEQCYFNQKRWLINRMVLGWGVVCGLGVERRAVKEEDKGGKHDGVIVRPGLAIDCCGREVLVCEDQEIRLDHLAAHCHFDPDKPERHRERLVICLEYFECKTEPVRLPPVSCQGEETTEFNRIRDGFKIRVMRWGEVDLERAGGRYCPLHQMKHEFNPERKCETELVDHHICRHLKEECPQCSERGCIVLAVVTVSFHPRPHKPDQAQQQEVDQSETSQQRGPEPDEHQDHEQRECGEEGRRWEIHIDHIDTCSYRRLVYNNPLLYDLINCFHGDPPHIVDYNWREILLDRRRVVLTNGVPQISWDTFAEILRSGLRVTFDQPLKESTIHRGTFLFTIKIEEERGRGYRITRHVPYEAITYEEEAHPAGEEPIDKEKKRRCSYAEFRVDRKWLRDEVEEGGYSELQDELSKEGGHIDVEITLRGSSILGQNGKALDGDFIAGKLPTGNGVQGGDFFDCFTVVANDQIKDEIRREEEEKRLKEEEARRREEAARRKEEEARLKKEQTQEIDEY